MPRHFAEFSSYGGDSHRRRGFISKARVTIPERSDDLPEVSFWAARFAARSTVR